MTVRRVAFVVLEGTRIWTQIGIKDEIVNKLKSQISVNSSTYNDEYKTKQITFKKTMMNNNLHGGSSA